MGSSKKIDFSTYKRIQRMSYNDFSRWLTTFAAEMYNNGKADCIENPECGMLESDDGILIIVNEEDLFKCLVSVKGIGTVKANQIIEALTNFYCEA